MLCPRRCGANRAAGERGICGADDRLLIARAALHEWEEPPISVGPGSGAVFFTGCPLRCVYCQNGPISMGSAGCQISFDRLVQIFLELQDRDGAANINLVTPTHQAPWIVPAVREARARGLHVPIVYNTSGYETAQAIRALAGTVDVYLVDFKYAPDTVSDAARAYSRAAGYHDEALAALDEMLSQVGEPRVGVHRWREAGGDGPWMEAPALERGVIVRHLLLPGALENSLRALEALVSRFGDSVEYSLMNQYTPVISLRAEVGDMAATRMLEACPQLGSVVPASEYEQLLDYADGLGMEDYFWQEGPAAEESFVPAWDGTGVQP
jgi:putative pyruvate formate lyase activating enzyme